jgi:hypothetical protein
MPLLYVAPDVKVKWSEVWRPWWSPAWKILCQGILARCTIVAKCGWGTVVLNYKDTALIQWPWGLKPSASRFLLCTTSGCLIIVYWAVTLLFIQLIHSTECKLYVYIPSDAMKTYVGVDEKLLVFLTWDYLETKSEIYISVALLLENNTIYSLFKMLGWAQNRSWRVDK